MLRANDDDQKTPKPSVLLLKEQVYISKETQDCCPILLQKSHIYPRGRLILYCRSVFGEAPGHFSFLVSSWQEQTCINLQCLNHCSEDKEIFFLSKHFSRALLL